METDDTPPPHADFDLAESDFAPSSPAVRKMSKLDRLTPRMLLGVALVSTCLFAVLLVVPLVAFGASLWYGYQYVRDVQSIEATSAEPKGD